MERKILAITMMRGGWLSLHVGEEEFGRILIKRIWNGKALAILALPEVVRVIRHKPSEPFEKGLRLVKEHVHEPAQHDEDRGEQNEIDQ
jgi:hypothetical protein